MLERKRSQNQNHPFKISSVREKKEIKNTKERITLTYFVQRENRIFHQILTRLQFQIVENIHSLPNHFVYQVAGNEQWGFH